MQSPEQLARQTIDRLLEAAGWKLQDHAAFNRNAALGVAVREFSLPNGACDYLSTGKETWFCDQRDPKPRSRRGFHTPKADRESQPLPVRLRSRFECKQWDDC